MVVLDCYYDYLGKDLDDDDPLPKLELDLLDELLLPPPLGIFK